MDKFHPIAYSLRIGRSQIAILWMSGLATPFLFLVLPWQVGKMTNLFGEGEEVVWPPVIEALLMIIAATLTVSFLSYIQGRSQIHFQEKLTRTLALDLFARVIRFDAEFFRNRPVESINTRLLEDSRSMIAVYSQLVSTVPVSLYTLVVLGGYMLYENLLLGSIMIPLAILSGYFLLFDRQIQQITRDQRKVWDTIRVRSNEVVSCVDEQRRHAAFEHGLRELEHSFRGYQVLMDRLGRWSAFFQASGPIVTVLQKSVLLGIGAGLCIAASGLSGSADDGFKWGAVMTFMLVVDRFANPVQKIATFLLRWRVSRENIRRVHELIEQPIAFPKPDTASLPSSSCFPRHANIEFNNVNVVSESGARILASVRGGIRAGQWVAIVGTVGCGKSTLMQLLTRDWTASDGSVLVGGRNVSEIDSLTFAREIGFAPQKPVLFDTTIRNNILFSLRRHGTSLLRDRAGKIDVSGLEGVDTLEDLDRDLVRLVRDVGLEEDVLRKGLDSHVKSPQQCMRMCQEIALLRSQIRSEMGTADVSLLMPFELDQYLAEGTLQENLLGVGSSLGEDQDSVLKEIRQLAASGGWLTDLLRIGLWRVRREQALVSRVSQQALKIVGTLEGNEWEEEVVLANPSQLSELPSPEQKLLLKTALGVDLEVADEFLKEDARFRNRIVQARREILESDGPLKNISTWQQDEGFRDAWTLRENLLLGRPTRRLYRATEKTDKAICRVLEKAECIEEALKLGMDSQVGEQGKFLSGGQRQKLALARVLLKRPSVLLLDEAAAALDELSSTRIAQLLKRDYAGKTVVSVSHQLRAIRDYDHVFVLDRGRIVQQGTFDELVACDGVFRELVSQCATGELRTQPKTDGPRPSRQKPKPAARAAARPLRGIGLFEAMDAAQLELVERLSTTVDCAAGTILFNRGDEGQEFYMLLEGEIELFVDESDAAGSRRKAVETLGPGQAFGELAICGAGTRTLSARAKTDVSLRILQRDDLRQLMEAEPSIAIALLEVNAKRLARLREKVYRSERNDISSTT